MPRSKKPRGRPVEYSRPERINASPEEIAEVVLGAKPKKMWRFEQERGSRKVIEEPTLSLSPSEDL